MKFVQLVTNLTKELRARLERLYAAHERIDLAIITKPAYRRQGMATAVAARFVLECLEKNLEPHWDGANEASNNLAVELGYIEVSTYSISYVN